MNYFGNTRLNTEKINKIDMILCRNYQLKGKTVRDMIIIVHINER